uniref:F-box domain-containing protein n=1 Tax=Zooxanthella nutricula TaxID=1333877 RepID=A0A6U6GMC5_9DINO|mmetsp:Transcript_103909/g.318286  ORF Transcript_103909/g.318286 Transcript_103909/m.318286 type:complete len:582 (+) Transcript_103909:73-1818(+)
MVAEFRLVCAVGTPGTVGRLGKCCRAFRSIFTSEEVWKALCENVVGSDVMWKDTSTSWRDFYGQWCQSARAWFRAYARLGRGLAEHPSFSMRVEFIGEDLPEEWSESAELRVADIDITDLGITGEVHLTWSDSQPFASLPRWTCSTSRRIRRIRVLGGDAASQVTLLEVDAGDSRSVLDFAKSELVECAGLSIDHWFCCEGDEDIDDRWYEELGISVRIPMDRFLAAVLGTEEAKAAGAEYLGRSMRPDDTPANPMLFAEVDGSDAGDVTASLSRIWPSPTWYSPHHAFQFRYTYGSAFNLWRQQDAEETYPMPGYRFTFDFDKPAVTFRGAFFRSSQNSLSLWCLDASGNTSFARHRMPCTLGSKYKCSFLDEPSAIITPTSVCNFVLCELQASRPVDVSAGGIGSVVELAALNILMMPFTKVKGFPDRSSLLNTVGVDYAKRLLHRFVAYTAPEVAGTSSANQKVSEICQPENVDSIIRKLVQYDSPEFEIMSEDSDQEEEHGFWKCHMARRQQKLIDEMQMERHCEPAKVSRPSSSKSIWHRMAPLKRCGRCRCILTGLQDDFAEEGSIYRRHCFRCA